MSMTVYATYEGVHSVSGLHWSPAKRLAVACPANDDLLVIVDAGPEDRVLVLGGDRADLLCAALRRGCRSAVGLVGPQRHPEAADVVIAPRVDTQEEALAVAECAKRALRGAVWRGRLAICIVGTEAWSLARSVGGCLVTYGFTRTQMCARAEGGILLVCELAPDIGPCHYRRGPVTSYPQDPYRFS